LKAAQKQGQRAVAGEVGCVKKYGQTTQQL
jgi:hypothetical protein